MASDLTRRRFLAATLGGVGAVWITASWSDLVAAGAAARRAARGQPEPFKVLTPADAADIEAVAAQIIPSDETPGAKEMHIIHFIDHSLATFAKEQRPIFAKGVMDLRAQAAKQFPGAKSFAALDAAKQTAVLKEMEKAKSPFFEMMRGATIVGMLAFPEYGGNYNKAGWKLIGFEDQFSWAPPFGYYDRT